jgi:hypothetical protein
VIRQDSPQRPLPSWTFVTSHGLALLFVAAHPDATIREIAGALEISERRVSSVIRDLETGNFVVVSRTGRRNQYKLNPNARFRHPLIEHMSFSQFVDAWRRAQSERNLAAGGRPLASD